MSNIYSKVQLKPLTITDGDDIRIYKGFKLNARNVAEEGFKLLKAVSPALGAGIDSFMKSEEFDVPQTFMQIFQMLNMNLEPEHFLELCDKTMGSMLCNGELVEDWCEHFDKYPQDHLEVMAWAGKENFHDFFMRSGMVASKLKWIKEKIPQEVKSLLK
jgi:hypothetical protein